LIKEALRMMPYGFYALTSKNGDEVNAMVVNWVTQVSFEPRLLAVGLQKTSHSHSLVEAGMVFGINIFHQDDKDAMMGFTKSTAKNPDKMKTAHYTAMPETGVPALEGAAAVIECRVKQIVDIGGDHDIVVGEVVGASVLKSGEPADMVSLVTIGWSYAG
jgi:flavin reductase (DIM6/NTAB) family NADH-FMN oxidoreductase RutF